MSSSPEILDALDRCIEELENMSESERAAFAADYWGYFEQRETNTDLDPITPKIH